MALRVRNFARRNWPEPWEKAMDMMLVLETAIAAIIGYAVADAMHRSVVMMMTLQLMSRRFREQWNVGEEGVDEEKAKWLIFGVSSVLLLAAFVAGDLVVALLPFFTRVFAWAMSTFGLQVTQLIIVVVVVLGVGAFFFKSNAQISYGSVELLFAWIAGIITARQMRPGTDWSGQLATLIGAVYIVSRGLGNIKEGIIKRNKAKNAKS
jgi:hypothetical protein